MEAAGGGMRQLGCAKCRYSRGGCMRCRSPSFQPRAKQGQQKQRQRSRNDDEHQPPAKARRLSGSRAAGPRAHAAAASAKAADSNCSQKRGHSNTSFDRSCQQRLQGATAQQDTCAVQDEVQQYEGHAHHLPSVQLPQGQRQQREAQVELQPTAADPQPASFGDQAAIGSAPRQLSALAASGHSDKEGSATASQPLQALSPDSKLLSEPACGPVAMDKGAEAARRRQAFLQQLQGRILAQRDTRPSPGAVKVAEADQQQAGRGQVQSQSQPLGDLQAAGQAAGELQTPAQAAGQVSRIDPTVASPSGSESASRVDELRASVPYNEVEDAAHLVPSASGGSLPAAADSPTSSAIQLRQAEGDVTPLSVALGTQEGQAPGLGPRLCPGSGSGADVGLQSGNELSLEAGQQSELKPQADFLEVLGQRAGSHLHAGPSSRHAAMQAALLSPKLKQRRLHAPGASRKESRQRRRAAVTSQLGGALGASGDSVANCAGQDGQQEAGSRAEAGDAEGKAAAGPMDVDAAPGQDPRTSLWVPPASPYCLVEEVLYRDPWKLLLACMLLNKTSAKQARPVLRTLFQRWPTAHDMSRASPADLEPLLRPLGLFRKRALFAVRFSQEYLDKQWTDPRELHGMGQYAADAYFMFCRGQWQQLQPEDKDLKRYHAFLAETGGAGMGLERECDAGLLGAETLPAAACMAASTADAAMVEQTATSASGR